MARYRQRHRSSKRPMAQMNVVPYIDVMLVLLVIFMITAPMLTSGVKVDLPQAAKSEPVDTQGKEPLVVTVDANGRYYLNSGQAEHPLGPDDLLPKVAAALRQDPTTQVHVKGDRAVDYGAVVYLMDLLKKAGAPTVGLITDQTGTPARPRPERH